MALHEYPFKDDPWPEDMGRATRRFSIEGFVVGDDYDLARNDLIEALDTEGPGELVHPYYGRRMVSLAGPVLVSESSTEEGGVARFPMEFIPFVESVEPSARIDTREQINAAADEANAAAADDFADNFSVDGEADFVSASAVERVRSLVDSLHGIRQGMLPDFSVVTDYLVAAKMLTGGIAGIMRIPTDLAGRIMGLIAGIRGLAIAPALALDGLRKLFGYGKKDKVVLAIPRRTSSRIVQSNNAIAINNLVQRAAVIESVVAASTMEFDSYTQAVAVRDELVEQIDAVVADAPDPVYRTMTNLRLALVRDVAARGGDLGTVAEVTMARTLPALVVAYRIYGDATRDAEIVTRNAALVRHPGFVPGGVALDVLKA
ncbi:DNA circularization N-terminal domain-containing protein [Denitratisoma sp. agr-D3]